LKKSETLSFIFEKIFVFEKILWVYLLKPLTRNRSSTGGTDGLKGRIA